MSTVGQWVVGVNLKFESNVTSELELIARQLKALQEGGITGTANAFAKINKAITGIKEAEGITFSGLGDQLTLATDKTKAATDAMSMYARAIRRVNGANLGGGGAGGSGGGRNSGSGGHGGSGAFSQFAQGFLPNSMMPGMLAYSLGSAVKDGIMSGIETSAGFQQYLNIAANMGDMSAAQKARWSDTMTDISGKTGINPVDVMHSSLDIVRLMKGTMTTDDMADIAPKLFKAAKVLEVTRGYDPAKSIDNIVEITHMLHDYKPEHMKKMMDIMLGSSELISQDPEKLKRQMAYFAGGFKNAGISDKDTFAAIVMASRAGMGSGKGGTSLNNFLGAILGQADITSFRAQMRKESVKNIIGGDVEKFYYADEKGGPKTLHIIDALDNVMKYATAHPGWKTIPELNAAFGVQGGRFASLMSDPETVKAFMGTRHALDDPNMSVENLYNKTMDNFNPQADRAKNSFAVLGKSLTITLLPSLTNVASTFADMMINIASVINKNPHILDGARFFLDDLANMFVHIDKAVSANPKVISDVLAGVTTIGDIFLAFAGMKAFEWLSKVTGLLKAATFLSDALLAFSPGFEAIGAIGIGTFTIAAALPLAIAGIIAAIGAAIFFPKQFKGAQHIVIMMLQQAGDFVVTEILHFVHYIWDSIQNALHKKPEKPKSLDEIRKENDANFEAQKKAVKNFWDETTHYFSSQFKREFGPKPVHTPSVRHTASVGHAAQTAHAKKAVASHAQPVHVQVAINAPVFGVDQLNAVIDKAVKESLKHLGNNPLSLLANNSSMTSRTNKFIPGPQSITTA